MDCFCVKDEDASHGFQRFPSKEALKFDKNFNGPVSQRSPTDLFWLKLFVGFLVCWFLIAFYAFAYGNFDHLTRMNYLIIEDVKSTCWYIVFGFVFAAATCFIIIYTLQWIATYLVWFSIAIFIGIWSLLTYVAFKQLAQSDNSRDSEKWVYIGIFSAISLLVALLMILLLQKQIKIAIEVIKEGSRAISSIQSALFVPIYSTILQVGVCIFACFVGLFLVSTGTPTYRINDFNAKCTCSGPAANYNTGDVCDPDIFDQYCAETGFLPNRACGNVHCAQSEIQTPGYILLFLAFNILEFFWCICFITGIGEVVLGSTFATWYWTFDKLNFSYRTLIVGLNRTIRYHLGTVAFGSFIMAVCSIIKLIIDAIESSLSESNNAVERCIGHCIKYLFELISEFVKMINRNAYIMCAVHGKPFCMSARDAFNLLKRNISRFAALHNVTEILFFVTKLLISFGFGGATYLCLSIGGAHLNYIAVPVVIVMIETFWIASIFLGIYSVVVDTLFLCVLEDDERNDGTEERPYHMPNHLMEVLSKENRDNVVEAV